MVKKKYGDIGSSLRDIYNTANKVLKKCVPMFYKNFENIAGAPKCLVLFLSFITYAVINFCEKGTILKAGSRTSQ